MSLIPEETKKKWREEKQAGDNTPAVSANTQKTGGLIPDDIKQRWKAEKAEQTKYQPGVEVSTPDYTPMTPEEAPTYGEYMKAAITMPFSIFSGKVGENIDTLAKGTRYFLQNTLSDWEKEKTEPKNVIIPADATEEERKAYYSLSGEDADKYSEYLNYKYDERNKAAGISGTIDSWDAPQAVKNTAKLARAIPSSIRAGVEGLTGVAQGLAYGNIDRKNFVGSDIADQLVGEVVEDIDARTKGTAWDISDTALGRMTGTTNIASFLVQSGYSGAQSLAMMATMGPVGVALMSGQAAASAMKESLDNGDPADVALGYGIATGVFEALFEEVSLEKVIKGKNVEYGTKGWLKQTIKNYLKYSFTEGSEEFFTEVADTLSEAIIRGDESQFAKDKAEYLATHSAADESSATAYAIQKMLGSAAAAFVGGALSGGVMGTVTDIGSTARTQAGYRNVVNQYAKNNNTEALYNILKENAETTGREFTLEQTADKKAYAQEVAKTLRGISTDTISQRLKELGVQDNADLATAIYRQANNYTLTSEEKSLLNSDIAQTALRELTAEKIEDTPTWVREMNAAQYAVTNAYDSNFAEETEVPAETPAEAPEETAPKEKITYEYGQFLRRQGYDTSKYDIEEVSDAESISSYAQANGLDYGDLNKAYMSLKESNPLWTPVRYENVLDRAYLAGKLRLNLESLANSLSVPLDSIIEQRYQQGMQDSLAANSIKAKNAEIRRNGYTFRNDGNASFATEEDIRRVGLNAAWTIKDEDLNEKQRAQVNFWTKMLEGSHVKIKFYASDVTVRGSQRGAYVGDENTIYLDVNDSMIRNGVHEFVHQLRYNYPELYEELKQFIIDKFFGGDESKLRKYALDKKAKIDEAQIEAQLKSGVIESEDQYRSSIRDVEDAIEEIVALSSENIFDNIEDLADIAQNHKTLWQKIVDFFEKMLDTLKEVIKGYGRNNPYAEELAKDQQAIEHVRNIILQAIELSKAAPVVNTDIALGTADAEVQMVSEDTMMADLTEMDELAPYSVEWDRGLIYDGESYPVNFATRTGIDAVGFTYDQIEVGDKEYLSIKVNGKTLDKNTDVKTIQKLIAETDSPLNRLLNLSKSQKIIGDDEIEAAQRATAQFIHTALVYGQDENSGKVKLDSIWKWAGSEVFKSTKPNSDKQYGTSLDLQTICKKTEQLLDAISDYQVATGRGVTPGEVMRLYLKTGETGYQTPCPFCYVFSHWIRMGLLYETAASAEDHYMAKLKEPGGINDVEWWKEEYRKQKEFASNDSNKKAIEKARGELENLADIIDQYAILLADAVNNGNEKEVNKLKATIDTLNERYVAAYQLVSAGDYASWIGKCILNVPQAKNGGIDAATAYGDYKIVDRDVLFDFRRSDELVREYPALARFRTSKGSAGGKAVENYADNKFGEVIAGIATGGEMTAKNALLNGSAKDFERQFNSAVDKIRKQNLRGGQRIFSWSDNRIDTGMDMLFNFIQLAAMGAAVQSYTKQLEGLELISAMGGYCNASLIGKDNGYKDGKLVFSTIQGIEPETTFELNRRYDKAGNILVGMSYEHIRIALADNRIFFVIPWHRSGLSDDNLERMTRMLGELITQHKDFSDFQNERTFTDKLDGTKLKNKTLEGYSDPGINVTDLWRRIETMSAKGLSAEDIPGFADVQVEDGRISDSQWAYRALRAKVMQGAELTTEEQIRVNGDIYLRRLQSVMKAQGIKSWGTDDIGSIYPYEYWDESSTYSNADRNNVLYLEYCRRLGVVPKFSGINSMGTIDKEADFTTLPGYWKVLVDRRMYDTKGKYQGLTPVSLAYQSKTQPGFLMDLITPEGIKAREEEYAKLGLNYKVTRLADAEGARKIAKAVQSDMSGLPVLTRTENAEEALKAYKALSKGKKLDTYYGKDLEKRGTKYSTRDYWADDDYQKLTQDGANAPLFQALQQTINAETTYWIPTPIQNLYVNHPELDFATRIQNGDGKAAFELADLLAKCDSSQLVQDIRWYCIEGHHPKENPATKEPYYNSKGQRASYSQTHRKGIAEFRRLCDDRLAQLQGSDRLNIKAHQSSLEEIRNLFDRLNSNADIARLADRIWDIADKLKLAVVITNEGIQARNGEYAGGYYVNRKSPETDRLGLVVIAPRLLNSVAASNQEKGSTILHELIHTVTYNGYRAWDEGTIEADFLPDSVKNAYRALDTIYHELKRSSHSWVFITRDAEYGMSSPEEFIAELSNPNFRDALADFTSEDVDYNAYVKSLEAVADAIGINRRNSVGQNTLRILDYFIDSFDSQAIRATRMWSSRRQATEAALRNSHIPKYSTRDYDFSKSFAEQLDDLDAGKFPTNDTLVMGPTPKVFQDIGLLPLPMTYTQAHAKDAIKNADGDHLGKDLLKKIPNALKSPIAIIDSSSRPGRLVAIVELQGQGKPVVAAVEVDGTGRMRGNLIDGNAVASVYSKSNAISGLLRDAIASETNGNGGIYYWDKQKAAQMVRIHGVQFPGVSPALNGNSNGTASAIPNGIVHSINDSVSKVKRSLENISDTKQFKRWFAGSKIVNEDGTPKVVYHGTDQNFTVFDPTKGRSNMDIRGMFFSPWELDAQGYGPNVGAYYLSIKNPAPEGIAYKALNMFKGQNEAGIKARDYLIRLGYDGVNNGDEEYIAFYPEQIKSATDNIGTFDAKNPDVRYSTRDTELSDDLVHYSVRTEPAPKKTVPVYKLMRYENGNLYPLYIDNSNPIEIGIWYNADSPKISDLENLDVGYAYKIDSNGNVVDTKPIKGQGSKASGLPNKQAVMAATTEGTRWIAVTTYANGGKAYYNVGLNGTGSPSLFAMRPGWHAGSLPTMRQIGKGPQKNLRDDTHVWVEGEMSADKDYQAEAETRPTKDIPDHIPTDGYYIKATNPNAAASQSDRVGWYIGGAFKVNRIISDTEAREAIDKWNSAHPDQQVEYDFPRESGRTFDGKALYSTRTELSNYEILAELLDSRLTNDADKDALRIYKNSYNEALKIRARLDELNALIREETHPAEQHNYQIQINELRKSLRKREELLDQVLSKPRIAAAVAAQKEDIQKLEGYLMDEQMSHEEDIAKLRERMGKLATKIERQAERFREYRSQVAESKGINYYRPRIEKVAKSLGEQVQTTLPIPFRQPIAGVLSLLDFTTKQDGSVRANKANFDRATAQAQFAKMAQDSVDPDEFFRKYGIEIAPEFAEWVATIQQWFSDATSGMSTKDIRAMDSYELASLYKFLKNIDTAAKKATKMYQAKAGSVADLGKETMGFLAPLEKKDQNKILGGIDKFLGWENAQPATVFDRFGGAGRTIFRGFQDAQDQLAWDNKFIREFAESINAKHDTASWRTETVTAEIAGMRVTAPVAYWMELYALTKQKDSYRHLIEGGGFIFQDYTEKGKTYKDTERFLDETDLIAINNVLTQEQRDVADQLKEFMARVGSEWGNKISRARFGLDLFGTIEDYYPIKTIRSLTQEARVKDEDRGNLYALMNRSWTKGRVMNAKNALVAGDIFATFSQHMGEMATYHSFALPTLDAIKWLNYKTNEQSTDGKIREDSVQGAMKQAYGDAAAKYIFDFLDSVNGTAQAKDDTMALRLVGAKNRVAVGANLRVIIQQPLSLVRAFSEISPKWFGLVNYKTDHAEMMKYSGIAEWKENGHYETNISRTMLDSIFPDKATARAKKVTDVTMKGAELGDSIAWTAMWVACRNEVSAENPGLKGDELMAKVADRFRDIIYRTQVVDSTLTRSDYMRKKDYFHRITSSFKSEPTTTLNMLIRAVDAFRYDSRRSGKASAWQNNRHLIAQTLVVFLTTQFVNAAATAIIDAFRDDDDYETWLEKWADAFKASSLENVFVLSSVPYIADVISVLRGYTPTRPDMDIASSMVSTAKQLYRSVETASMTPKTIFNLVTAASYATGLPMQNVMRDVVALYNGTIGILYDMQVTDSTSAKFQLSPETNKSGYEKLYEALRDGKAERAMSLISEMDDNNIKSSSIYSGTYNIVKSEYQAGRITKAEAKAYVKRIAMLAGVDRTDKQISDLVDGW